MTDNSTSYVGRNAIDAYLDSVEQALLAVHAPRSDRLQVLEDLESQIDDMLAQQPQPLTEETVRSVIEKLEPPSHFAATYGNGKQPNVDWPSPAPAAAPGGIRWSRVAVASFVLPFLGTFLEWLIHITGGRAGGEIMVLSIMAGLVLTPCALALAYWQLRAQPGRYPDRDFVFNMIIGFAVVGPAFLMIVLMEWTYTLVFVPIGIVGYVYLHYKLVQRFRRYLAETLPPQSARASSVDAGEHEAPPPTAAGMPAPAM